MAGFFSPAAAFVTGFANQANENIERGRMEDRQNDLIWANKFEKGKAEYEKEQKDTKEKTKLYNTLLGMVNNDPKAADIAFQAIQLNPKNAPQIMNWVQDAVDKGATSFKAGPDYQSSTL